MARITPFLWFDADLDQVTSYYASVFTDMRVTSLSTMTAAFEIEGQAFMALKGGPAYRCADQGEVDHYWSALTADGGQAGQCGWLKDRYGLSWQIVPEALGRYLGDADREKAARVARSMRGMTKIIIDELEAAAEGRS